MSSAHEKKILDVIKAENLGHYVWMGDVQGPLCIGIRQTPMGWNVFFTNERGSVRTDVPFQSETDALDDFLDKLRWLNRRFRDAEERGESMYD